MTKVSEIFYSIQGEGPNIGVPSIFVRLFGCNLQCTWCDTKYATGADGTHQFKEYDTPTLLSEIYSHIKSMEKMHIVFTGGEPLLQYNQIKPVIDTLRSEGHLVTIETNGVFVDDFYKDSWLTNHVDYLMVSPKLESSGNKQAYNITNLKKIINFPRTFLKFVISSDQDFIEALKIISETGCQNSHCYMMPEGIDRVSLEEKNLWLVELCKQYNFVFCPRLQVYLWGNQRGV